MFSLLLAIIYISFISLGLPDSLLGSAWPVMRLDFGAPLSYAGIVTMIIAGGTIISSLLSDRLNKKLGTGLVTSISVSLTAIALLGFSFSDRFFALCLFAIPYGLGAGAVDAALNNYVALHYSSRHMSWLHCFWGVGASISPYIMSAALALTHEWQNGYRYVSIIQIVLSLFLFLSLPVWKKENKVEASEKRPPLPLGKVLKIRNVVYVLFAFFAYCALESTCGLWASSYLVESRNVGKETAAMFGSLFYLGITVGRFISGFVADRVGDKKMIRIGTYVVIVGIVMVLIPLPTNIPALAGLVIIGLGCAPIYPSIIHSTPKNFGKENSQAIVGVQMASAYLGSTFIPPIFGLIANNINIGWYPVFLGLFALLLWGMTEVLNKKMAVR